ncbi:hypothetical protein [Pseudomonas nitroreducens]|uniref:hypothetical protein n=1 Tax=Pseudomonas nitroreducens TaxID=46680 RepID=UPI00117A7C2B|nr:hypothetical protein [Pseudomonas nitroreducens]NMZ58616.1 hypothetical protein [Pseudomonas nitroreducens]
MDEANLMELAFETEQLSELCRSDVVAYRELPRNVANVLFRRLADIRAASHILHLPVGKPREIESNPPGIVLVNLCDGYHLLFSAVHREIPVLTSGGVDWDYVSRVKLLKIGASNE